MSLVISPMERRYRNRSGRVSGIRGRGSRMAFEKSSGFLAMPVLRSVQAFQESQTELSVVLPVDIAVSVKVQGGMEVRVGGGAEES